MSADLTDILMHAIGVANIVPAERLSALREFVAVNRPDPPGVVKEIRRQGLLTDFQIREISRGRGKELTLGPYTLLALLGEGGMGRVFKAHHNRLGRDVALKVIRKEKLTKPAVVQRFHQEIRAAAQLSHPNVILAFDADEADGVHYFAMEFAEGTDLTKLVRAQGPMAVPAACDAIRQAAIGLQHAYERGLVHRDVKPSNLLLTPKGQVKLLDLGLAMLNEAPGGDKANRVTQAGLVLGTPDFLAPEQAQNPLGVDIRADVYALGATLYYLLTGKVPYDGVTPADKLLQHVLSPPPKLLEARRDAPPELDALIQWLMAKRPEDRPQTPAQVAAILLPFCPAGTNPGVNPLSATHAAYAPELVPVPAEPPLDLAAATAIESEPPAPADTRGRQTYSPHKPAAKGWLAFAAAGSFALVAIAGLAYALYVVSGGAARPLPAEFTTAQGLKLLRLEGGPVELGSSPDSPGHEASESPTAAVEVPGPFFVGATEVTQGQYRQVMGGSPATWAPRLRDSKNAPVDSVTFAEATEFCKKLTALDGANARPGWAYRLPTEAEWEYACRAGSTHAFAAGDKLVYGKSGIFSLDRELATKGSLGEEDLSKPNMERNFPYPVRSTEPNAFGLYDLHGNVWEWVGDAYEPGHTGTAPTDGGVGEPRVQKGGSWKEPATRCRSAARRGVNPETRRDDVGFRVVFAPVPR